MLKYRIDSVSKVAGLMLLVFMLFGFSSSVQAGGAVVDFKQASNKNPIQGDVIWIGSILQTSNSSYYEGMSTPQRLVLVSIPKTPGDTHTLTLSHQANKGTSHAYDFLTSWPQALQAASEIGGPTMFVNLNECGPDIGPPSDLGAICAALHSGGFTATTDAPEPGIVPSLPGDNVPTVVANYEAHFGNRTIKIYGNTPISSWTATFNGYSKGSDYDAEYTLSWTSSSDSIIIEMAGHLAVGIDPLGAGIGYGEGLGSASISGGPYHFSLSNLDGSSLGSQDNQVKGADILLPPPVCDVTPSSQGTCVGASATFTDNTSGGTPPYTYCWKKEPYTGDCLSTTDELIISATILDDAGEYRVVVSGADGLTDTCYAELIVYPPPGCDVTPDHDTVSVGFDASFTASGSGGTSPYTYDWTGPAGFTADMATIDIHNAQLVNVGTYQVIVTDAHDCADTCSAELMVYASVVIIASEDDSVHAGDYFISENFSTSGGFGTITVSICGITPTPVHQPTIVESHVEWQTECADDGEVFTICLEAADELGSKDTAYFDVTVYNRPPELTCPDDGIVSAGETFTSTDFSVFEPDGDPAPVAFLNITPAAANDPVVVGSHVEWTTVVSEWGKEYSISLVATDHCGLADTCQFKVTVDVPTGEFECPDDDSVHAGAFFVSTDFTLTYPECDPSSVEILGITPPPTNNPVLVDYHVEWQTTCEEDGDYQITLITGDECSVPDTCSFTVTVYNLPPELTCPDYGQIHPLGLFVSTDFYVNDPYGEEVVVSLLGICPDCETQPVIVERHVEWQTCCLEGDWAITLVATDPCGLADTCEFWVSVYTDPKPDFYIWVYPTTQYVAAGQEAGYIVELSSMLGFSKQCSLYVSGLPDPPNLGIFDQTVITPSDFTTLNVQTTPSTNTGTYTLTLTGKEISGMAMHSTQVDLVVGEPSDVGDEASNPNTPMSFALFQNQPNPFNPLTHISYYLPTEGDVELTIYNVLGQKVRVLFSGYQNSGLHTITWNGRNDAGVELSSGIYLYRLKAGDFMDTKKMTLIK